MTTAEPLLVALKQAHHLARQFRGGYSNSFSSAEEFANALGIAIEELEHGNEAALNRMVVWFSPTCDWDDLIGAEGILLGQRVFDLLSDRLRSSCRWNSP